MKPFLQIFNKDLPAVLAIPEAKKTTYYFLRHTKCDWDANGWRLSKIYPEPTEDDKEYHVLLSKEGSSCDCKGHLSHGTSCKHISSLWTLMQEGQLEKLANVD